ncbi:hypothetical protein [Clostridium saccharoperbutylacetonicum]|uniref:hypothetical protein n=1 Tax=Clostridium saccharoperbutylacetonicum TaxID=36745 RepID=UPI0039EA95EE
MEKFRNKDKNNGESEITGEKDLSNNDEINIILNNNVMISKQKEKESDKDTEKNTASEIFDYI